MSEKKVPPENIAATAESENTEEMAIKKSEDKVIIHTMPKRFYSSSAGSDKSKNVGVIIMIMGVLFLIIIAGVLYFLFLKPNNQATPAATENVVVPVTKKATTTKEEIKTIENQIGDASTTQGSIVENSTTTNNITEPTTIPEVASTTTTETQASSSPTVDVPPAVVENIVAKDTDSDGLTDAEEGLFGTIVNLKDTDGDGYSDLSEVLGLYNPVGTGGIILNPAVDKYVNTKNGYSLYYIKKMTVENVGGSEDSVMFKFSDGQMIQVIVSPNNEKLSIDEWYKKQFSATIIGNQQIIYKKGWTGIMSEDGLTAYLTNPASNNIFTLSYNISVDHTLSYKNIFQMMINSLELK